MATLCEYSPAAIREQKHLSPGQSFRFYRWCRDEPFSGDVDLRSGALRRVPDADGWHYHAELELTCFETGGGMRHVADSVQEIAAGDVVALGENVPHCWRTSGRSSGWTVLWRWDPTDPLWRLRETTGLTRFFRETARGIRFLGATRDALGSRMPELAFAEGADQLGLFLRILAAAARAPAPDRAPISRHLSSQSVESRHQAAMEAVMRFLLENYRQEIRLPQVLEIARMSKPTFSRQFKGYAGRSLGDFLQQVRLNAVCHELVETDRTVTDIAFSNGFSHLSFFNRLFRRVHGCNALDYRRRGRRLELAGLS